MPKPKMPVTYIVEADHVTFLCQMTEGFDLPDESKALRVLIEYALQDGDLYQIFAAENMRCRHPDNCLAFKAQEAKTAQQGKT
jgi:hypothetical protein